MRAEQRAARDKQLLIKELWETGYNFESFLCFSYLEGDDKITICENKRNSLASFSRLYNAEVQKKSLAENIGIFSLPNTYRTEQVGHTYIMRRDAEKVSSRLREFATFREICHTSIDPYFGDFTKKRRIVLLQREVEWSHAWNDKKQIHGAWCPNYSQQHCIGRGHSFLLQLTLSLLELHTCTGLCKFMDKELRETRARGQKPKSRWDSRNSSLINLQSIVLNYVANADGIFLPTHV